MKYLLLIYALICTATGQPISAFRPAGSKGENTDPRAFKVALNIREFRPEDYGANPLDETDDRAGFQAAVNAAVAAGGGTVKLSPGKYLLSENGSTGYCILIPGPSVTIEGCGVGGRIACTDADATTLLFAKHVGTYAEGDYVDHGGVKDVYFNPSVQKTDAAWEIDVPCTRHFTASGLHFGRRDELVTGQAAAEESNIGACMRWGRDGSVISSNAKADNIRGFGYYQAIRIENMAGGTVDRWHSDANRNNADSILLKGHAEGCTFSDSDFVNSRGVVLTATGTCLRLEGGTSGQPRFNKFTACFFDTHRYGVYAVSGGSTDFLGCWINCSYAGCAVTLDTGATNYRFIGGQSCYARDEVFHIDAGTNHVISDFEIMGSGYNGGGGVAIRVGAGASVTLNNVRDIPGALNVPNPTTRASLYIMAGAGDVQINGGYFQNGIADMRSAVPASGISFWMRAQYPSTRLERGAITRWPNSGNSPHVIRFTAASANAPVWRGSYCAGRPAVVWNVGGRTSDWMAFTTESTGSRYTLALTDFTVIVVQKTTGDNIFLGSGDVPGASNNQVRLKETGVMSMMFEATGEAVSTVPVSTPRTSWSILEWQRSGSTIKFYENGTQLGTTVTGASTTALSLSRMSGAIGATSTYIKGATAEVLIYNRAITDAERALIVAEFQNELAEAFGL